MKTFKDRTMVNNNQQSISLESGIPTVGSIVRISYDYLVID